MRPPRIGMYLTAAVIIALVVTGAARLVASSWDWTLGTWAATFGVTLGVTIVVLYVMGVTSRRRTERRAFGRGPSLDFPGGDPTRRE